jgi:hypothetical protein
LFFSPSSTFVTHLYFISPYTIDSLAAEASDGVVSKIEPFPESALAVILVKAEVTLSAESRNLRKNAE